MAADLQQAIVRVLALQGFVVDDVPYLHGLLLMAAGVACDLTYAVD